MCLHVVSVSVCVCVVCRILQDFARNNSQKFSVTALDVGEVNSIAVRVDAAPGSTAPHSSWHCAKIETLNMTSGLKCVFNANRWIGTEDWTVSVCVCLCVCVVLMYVLCMTTACVPQQHV